MKQRILLRSPQDVEEFVRIASAFDYDIDLSSGATDIDAKSLLGVMTMCLRREMNVISQVNDDAFKRLISKFAVA